MPYAMIVQPQPKIEKATNAHDPQFLRCKLTPKLTPEKHLTKSQETMTYHKTMSIDFAKQLRSSSMCSKLNHIESAEIVWFNNFQTVEPWAWQINFDPKPTDSRIVDPVKRMRREAGGKV